MRQKELSQKMPQVAAFLGALVEAFGKEAIHGQVRAGLTGEPVFYAQENGYTIGTPIEHGEGITWHPVSGVAITVEELARLEQENDPSLHT